MISDMQIETTHIVDASEPDARGAYAYWYEYDVFRFSNEPMPSKVIQGLRTIGDVEWQRVNAAIVQLRIYD